MKVSQINTANYNLFKRNLFKRNEMNTIHQCPGCKKGAPLRDLAKDSFVSSKAV